MDVAYDHIQEEALSPEEAAKQEGSKPKPNNLNAEFQEAYKSFSASPWGARLGGFFNDVKKQSETWSKEAQKEASDLSGEAVKGFTDLKSTLASRARSMSTGLSPPATPTVKTAFEGDAAEQKETKERTESEALRESEGLIARFRSEATKRLKEVQKAEDAADEALLKFGTNIRNFLRDAVTVAPPNEEKNKDGSQKVLFESKDQDGKRVIHSTRFDAQLHAIHSSYESFTKDPASPEYEKWKNDFDAEKKTDAIAKDLEKYEELRRAMEKLVPEQVEYAHFWTRYYFLRMVIETEEQRRRELLKGAAMSPTESIGWDDDSDSETQSSTPHPIDTVKPIPAETPTAASTSSSTTTIQPPPTSTSADNSTLKPDAQPRRSQDQLSDTSYDIVSGATSRAPGSPKDEKKKGEESDEEPDWE
ncbi:MAG: hypothetical protein Q9195_009034 [Heterodermia aff. obscurata]